MEFDGILNSVLRSDWSVDLPNLSSYYVTWGATHVIEGVSQFGKPLGKLMNSDLAELIHKATVTYGKNKDDWLFIIVNRSGTF